MIFGEKAEYYQSLHALLILTEAIWKLFWEALQNWLQEDEVSYNEALLATVT